MKKSTTEEFVEKARNIHGDKYDYSLSNYERAIVKLKIRCIKHDLVFDQSPNGHLSGKGCPVCRYDKVSEKNSLTNNEFILKANEKHGYRFDYSKCEYISAKINVKIICSIHGEFVQTPDTHLTSKGCPRCSAINAGKKMRITPEKFKEKTDRIFNGKYTCLNEFKTLNTLMKIKCEKHGVFNKKAVHYFNGVGCILCSHDKLAEERVLGIREFIKRSNKKHSNKYSYNKVVYKNSNTKVNIICDIHGVFKQSPSKHMSGQGCPKCRFDESRIRSIDKSIGWSVKSWDKSASKSKNFDSFKVYIIKCWDDKEIFYKIGRTFCKVGKRFNTRYSMPYNYEVLKLIIFEDSRSAHNKENELKNINKSNRYMPKINFGGMYECFSEIKPIE